VSCDWCGRPFIPRRGATPQRFCTSRCRASYHKATRQWCEAEIAAGRLTIGAVRDGVRQRIRLLQSTKTSDQPWWRRFTAMRPYEAPSAS
jgi:hypothetical protein